MIFIINLLFLLKIHSEDLGYLMFDFNKKENIYFQDEKLNLFLILNNNIQYKIF